MVHGKRQNSGLLDVYTVGKMRERHGNGGPKAVPLETKWWWEDAWPTPPRLDVSQRLTNRVARCSPNESTRIPRLKNSLFLIHQHAMNEEPLRAHLP
jgi:hypothetical protein